MPEYILHIRNPQTGRFMSRRDYDALNLSPWEKILRAVLYGERR